LQEVRGAIVPLKQGNACGGKGPGLVNSLKGNEDEYNRNSNFNGNEIEKNSMVILKGSP
jgi:hypothetical protein